MGDADNGLCGCSFIPDYVFKDIAELEDAADGVKELAQATLDVHELEELDKELDQLLAQLDETLKELDEAEDTTDSTEIKAFVKPGLTRKVYTFGNKSINPKDKASDLMSQAQLVLHEDTSAFSEDLAASKCYEHFGDVYNFFNELFGRNSIDDNGLPLIGIVHYGSNYANAWWQPDKKIMVFGDGFARDVTDGSKPTANFAGYFGNFYDCLELIAHELMHGITTSVTKVTGGNCDTGAIVEHVADVFGIMVAQHKANHTVDEADWLFGQELILPEVKDMALRSFKDPGNAYVLPGNLGKDKQIAHFSQYKAFQDSHISSGILNHAFYLAAMKVGGYSWEKLGRIWWKTLTEGNLNLVKMMGTWGPWARKTIEFAGEYGPEVQNAVSEAWEAVGILPEPPTTK